MEISVRLEGGLGDCFLGNRFVAAIREKHPEANIHAYFDTEGNLFQELGLAATYAHLYKTFTTIPSKKFAKCMIRSQFGEEEYKGAFENVPDAYRDQMLAHDKFYDLHIDGLKWLDYDFDWLRYFRFFPKPNFTQPYRSPITTPFIAINLVSESSAAHRLQPWYIKRLVEDLSKILPVVAIATDKTEAAYAGLPCQVVKAPIGEILELISLATVMVSTDSGLRYIAYGSNVPVLTFSSQSNLPHKVQPSHELRWLVYPELCFPLHWSTPYISGVVERIVKNRGSAILPQLTDFDMQAVRRKYTLVSQS